MHSSIIRHHSLKPWVLTTRCSWSCPEYSTWLRLWVCWQACTQWSVCLLLLVIRLSIRWQVITGCPRKTSNSPVWLNHNVYMPYYHCCTCWPSLRQLGRIRKPSNCCCCVLVHLYVVFWSFMGSSTGKPDNSEHGMFCIPSTLNAEIYTWDWLLPSVGHAIRDLSIVYSRQRRSVRDDI